MSVDTFNYIVGCSMFFVSFSLSVRWLVLSYLDYSTKETHIYVQMTNKEFEKFVAKMEKENDDTTG